MIDPARLRGKVGSFSSTTVAASLGWKATPVRGVLREPQATSRLADSAADSGDLVRSALVHPPGLTGQGRALTAQSLIRVIGRILLTLAVFAVTGFIVLVLIGLQADFSREPKGVSSQAGDARQGPGKSVDIRALS